MTCTQGDGFVICDGHGGWYVHPNIYCPTCKRKTRCIGTMIFGGWCGTDYICGECGSKWSSDSEEPFPESYDESKAKKNMDKVAATKDPTCWGCRDTGDRNWNVPAIDPDTESDHCQCPAGVKLRGSEKESEE